MLRFEDTARADLDDWVMEFNAIYAEVNASRTSADIWFHVVAQAALLHQALRLGEVEHARHRLLRIFCWLCAFVKRTSGVSETLKLEASFEQLVLERYPAWCFAYQASPCRCPNDTVGAPRHTLSASEKQVRRQDARVRRDQLSAAQALPHTLSEFPAMFQIIYGSRVQGLPAVQTAARLQEEAGTVCRDMNALYGRRLRGLLQTPASTSDELADDLATAFAWLLVLSTKLTAAAAPSLEELIWRAYAGQGAYMVDPAAGERPARLPRTSPFATRPFERREET